jgi:c-di-GMP-binding flagellar brake protein YcgR
VDIEAFQITTPTTAQVIILVIVVFVIVIGLYIASRASSPGRKRGGGQAAGSGWHSFYHIAKTRGLGKQETEMLRRLVQECRLARPSLVFTSLHVLDSCIQRQVRRLSLREVQGESRDDLINRYYRLRNRVARARSADGVASTRAIPVGSRVRVMVQNHGSFTLTVNLNNEDCLGVSIPTLPPGRSIAWDKKRVKLSFWRENDAAYMFFTRVEDMIINDEVQSICLRHSDRPTRVQKRLYPRKSVRLPVFFTRVRVIEEGGRKKAVVDRKDTHWGTIIDISVGGLSIETTIPFNKNNYLRSEFELREDYKVVAFGKVKRIEQHRVTKNWIMHIQFTKIDKKHKNEIFALLYNYQTI